LPFFKSFSSRLGRVLALYGGWGLFAISFLDSSFLSFPLVNDLLLIHLASQSPRRAPLYAFLTASGSVLGAFVLYGLTRGGRRLLRTSSSEEKQSRAREWLNRNDFTAVLLASLLPPPFPLKPVVLAAGALRVGALRFGLALLIGRSLRFLADAWVGARYGASAEAYLKENLGRASLAIVALILAGVLLFRGLRKLRRPAPPGGDSGAASATP
jgi:membrane protein YqaA with SNARE-associated domain